MVFAHSIPVRALYSKKCTAFEFLLKKKQEVLILVCIFDPYFEG